MRAGNQALCCRTPAPSVLHRSSTDCTPALRSDVLSRTGGLDQQAVLHNEEVIAMTATQQRRQRSGRVMAALRRTVGTLRYVNDELVRANEAIFRPAGAPPPSGSATAQRPGGTSSGSATIATGNAKPAATEHTGRAA
jgi:hypothetical protein